MKLYWLRWSMKISPPINKSKQQHSTTSSQRSIDYFKLITHMYWRREMQERNLHYPMVDSNSPLSCFLTKKIRPIVGLIRNSLPDKEYITDKEYKKPKYNRYFK